MNVLEELASLEHEQWCDWSKAIAEDIECLLDVANLASVYGYTGMKDEMAITKMDNRLERWKTLWVPYEELSKEMKESNREYARKALDTITCDRGESEI